MKKTKKQKIKEHLEMGNTISQRDAIQLFNAYRLSAIIFDLKKDGIRIETIDKSTTNQQGETSRFAEYKMINAPGNKDQVNMFSSEPKNFRTWLDEPPKLKKGDIR
jgi:hypothetical protein|tara:strand:+ start:140 stop:457 length:318 start_codon:yes stop_codon:yes gene_type:complete